MYAPTFPSQRVHAYHPLNVYAPIFTASSSKPKSCILLPAPHTKYNPAPRTRRSDLVPNIIGKPLLGRNVFVAEYTALHPKEPPPHTQSEKDDHCRTNTENTVDRVIHIFWESI